MRVADIPEFSQLSTTEKLLLLEDLWDSISSQEDDMPVPQSHKDELDARLQSYEENPGDLLTLEELKQRIEKRK